MPSAYEFGHIVKADIPDPDGQACATPHYCMVLRPPDDDGDLYLVGISTRFDRPIPRLMIELPWEAAGHPDTGLYEPCVLKCAWVVKFNESRILRRVGRMPSDIAEQAVDYAITAAEEKQAAAAQKRANQ